MEELFDLANKKIGTVGDDGNVLNAQKQKIGHVSGNEVFDKSGNKEGSVATNGYVYRGSSHVGTVSGADIFDYSMHKIGKVKGENLELGGAVFILLIHEDKN